MAEKQITNNQLAKMIKKSFDSVEKRFDQMATKEQFEGLDKRVGGVEGRLALMEKDVKYIKENVEDARKLEQRVDYIENVLNIPTK